MFDAYLGDLQAQKDVMTQRQTDSPMNICLPWAAFAAEKPSYIPDLFTHFQSTTIIE